MHMLTITARHIYIYMNPLSCDTQRPLLNPQPTLHDSLLRIPQCTLDPTHQHLRTLQPDTDPNKVRINTKLFHPLELRIMRQYHKRTRKSEIRAETWPFLAAQPVEERLRSNRGSERHRKETTVSPFGSLDLIILIVRYPFGIVHFLDDSGALFR
jgi:hypothetical protein